MRAFPIAGMDLFSKIPFETTERSPILRRVVAILSVLSIHKTKNNLITKNVEIHLYVRLKRSFKTKHKQRSRVLLYREHLTTDALSAQAL